MAEAPDQMPSSRDTAVGVVRKLGVFLLVAVAGLVAARYTHAGQYLSMEAIQELSGRLGPRGPLVLFAAGLLSPLMFLPRWPIAFLAGLLYGVVYGTLLATVASTAGAWVHFLLSRSLLAPASARLLKRYGYDHVVVPREKQFLLIFVLRAFPLSSFVATNLLAGALKLSRGRFVLASLLGMIPSSLLYAAWGKLMRKPDPQFYVVAVVALVLLVAGAVAAQRFVQPLLKPKREG